MTLPVDLALESVPCPAGCPPMDEVVVRGRDRLHGLPGEFSVVRCRTCGLMRTNPRPDPESIAHFYPDEYGPYRDTRIVAGPAGSPWAPGRKRVAGRMVRLDAPA